jgi:hypothetical protein
MDQRTDGSIDGAEAIQAVKADQERLLGLKIIVVAVVPIIVFVAIIVLLEAWVDPDWPQVLEVLRDIFIILMAVESLAIGILLIVLVVQIMNLTQLLREEVLPILNSTNETVDTVKQTTAFVSDVVVSPLLKAVSTASAVQGGLRAIFRRRRPHNGSED